MLAPLLLATALAVRVQHVPVHQVAQAIVVGREAPQKVDEGSLNMFAYCDARDQATIMVTNAGPTAFVVEWTLTATKPGYPPDRWSSVSRVEPGQFEGWVSPAPFLHLDIRYDADGLPTADSIDAFCPATAGQSSGLEE
ncbi:MAG TPA: hypothetical protein VHQ44_01505 [Thermoanaerobaculia bacterium]|jgi:hypothetical protein|nr:hypothetical protein [Thermoanaerobaculia bacterium]